MPGETTEADEQDVRRKLILWVLFLVSCTLVIWYAHHLGMPIVTAVGGTIALWIACLTILARMFEKRSSKRVCPNHCLPPCARFCSSSPPGRAWPWPGNRSPQFSPSRNKATQKRRPPHLRAAPAHV